VIGCSNQKLNKEDGWNEGTQPVLKIKISDIIHLGYEEEISFNYPATRFEAAVNEH
jgi:hypothetical protein